MKLAIAIVWLSACTTFDPVPRNVCGNGIVEPGEDCDSRTASCVACAVTCTLATDCPNAAYSCGVDGLCHAPSGVVAPETAPSLFLVDDVRITDIDRDGIGDVLGVSKTSIAVRFGDAHGALTGSYSTVTPPQTGPAGFSDLDGDGSIDTSIATPNGIVTYASPYGLPSPMTSFLPLEVNGTTIPIVALFSLQGVAVGAIVADPTTSNLVLAVLEFDTSGVTSQGAALCALPAADFSPDDLDVYQASPDGSGAIDVLVAVTMKGASGRHLCASSIHLDAKNLITGARTAHVFDVTPTVGTVPQRKLVWADLDFDNDPCPSLVNSDGGGSLLRAWDGSMMAGHCGLAATSIALPVAVSAGNSAAGVGHIPFKPGASLLFGSDLLVLTTGAYLLTYTVTAQLTLAEVYRSERKLAHVATGDFDHDGAIDAVLTAEDLDDFDILYRAGNPILPGYIVLRVDTAGVVTSVTVDDYDGNGTSDIAYTESLLGHEALSVAYLDPAHTLTTAQQGTFNAVRSVIPFDVADASDPFSVIGDVLVLETLTNSSPAFTLLHGSPQRTMLSYFEPRPSDDPQRNDTLRQVVGGDFVASSGTQHRDLLAFLPTANTSPAAPSVTVYRLDGTDSGLDPNDPVDTAHGEQITGIDDCGMGGATAGGAPCIRSAMLVPWTTATAHDVIVGVDRQPVPKGYVIDPWAFVAGGSTAATPVSVMTANVPMGAVAHSSQAIDLDGDGLPDLVLAFGPSETASASGPGLVEVCAMSPNGVPQSCVDLAGAVKQAAPAVTACVDAAAGRFAAGGPTTTPSTAAELVVLCHDAVGESVVARIASKDGSYQATIVASNLGPLRSIAIGDVTGDGIDDIVAIRGDTGARTLTVLAQCEARDLACQAQGVAP